MNESPALIEAVTNGKIYFLGNKFQALLVFARKLTLDPGAVNVGDTEGVRSAGWSDKAIEDAISVISIFSLINRIVDGIGLPGTDEHYQQFAGMVSQGGHVPLVELIEQKIKLIQLANKRFGWIGRASKKSVLTWLILC